MGVATKSYVYHTIGGAKFYKEAQRCEGPHAAQDAPTIGGAQGEPRIYLPPPLRIYRFVVFMMFFDCYYLSLLCTVLDNSTLFKISFDKLNTSLKMSMSLKL